MESLMGRLEGAGLDQIKFQVVEEEGKGKNEDEALAVKTLIWEVVYDNAENGKKHYIATAHRYQDRIDEEKLKEELVNQKETSLLVEQPSTIIGLALARTEKAEELTGFMSGTIPPIGHATPMRLIVDQPLLDKEETAVDLGSGSFRHSIRMSVADMVEYAKTLATAVHAASITQEKQPSHAVNSNASPAYHDRDCPTAEDDKIQTLAKALREACLQKGQCSTIRSVIEQAGSRFPELVEQEELCFSRNPLHLAAWKADEDSIELLIETGKQHGMDLVNAIVTGDGNYGKTAIFYAINNGRDEIVRLLLSHGSNLLIKNRKGNTPCGLAEGRLSSETIQLLQQTQQEQFQKGGRWVDYRKEGTGDSSAARPSTGIEGLSLNQLAKKLRNSAGKVGKHEVVRSIIEEAGDRFPELVRLGSDGNFTKNALHLAAWKGDPESIELLIDAGNKYGLDLVNVISVGEGNYGKTPIFFAITQDRDDVVKLFIERGANLLIVNNKGQSPCSMSVSHLQSETCQFMFEKEHQQIRSGSEFQDYRASHGDDTLYGDLDPRFKIDTANYGVDIESGLQQFSKTVEARKKEGAHDQPAYKILPPSFEPRVLRMTTKESRQSRADSFNLQKSVCGQKATRSKLPSAKQFLAEHDTEGYHGDLGRQKQANEKPSPLMFQTEVPYHEYEELKVQLEKENINKLPRLLLSDLPIGGQASETKFYPTVICDASQILELAREVTFTKAMLQKYAALTDNPLSDNQLVGLSWGLDCEWKPSKDRGRENPVATLQLSSCKRSFLVDLQQLCQPSIKDPLTPMSKTEELLDEALSQVFSNTNIPVLGWGIFQDLSKLAVSFPHLPSLREFHAVVNLDVLFNHAFAKPTSKCLKSLRDGAAFLLQKRLDKAEQCSNWQQRPLTTSQIEYASLDAAILPCLLKEALCRYNSNNPATADSFFSKYPHLLVSWRLSFLDSQHIGESLSSTSAYKIDHGSSKNMLSLWYCRQTWQTGKIIPAAPSLVPLESQREARDMKKERDARKIGLKEQAKSERLSRKKKKALKLATIPVAKIPALGKFLGYTKEACILHLLNKEVLDSLEDDFYLGFNRRGGIIRMQNAWLLFVNFGNAMQNHKFNNKFSNGGRFMSFTLDPKKNLDELFYNYVSEGCDQSKTSLNSILLFIRPTGNSEYLFCGDCNCVGEEARVGNIDVLLEITRYQELCSTPYIDMVSKRPATL